MKRKTIFEREEQISVCSSKLSISEEAFLIIGCSSFARDQRIPENFCEWLGRPCFCSSQRQSVQCVGISEVYDAHWARRWDTINGPCIIQTIFVDEGAHEEEGKGTIISWLEEMRLVGGEPVTEKRRTGKCRSTSSFESWRCI